MAALWRGRDGENYSFNSIKSNPSTWQSSYQVIPRWVSEAEGSRLKLPSAATHLPQWRDDIAGCCSALNKGFKLTLSVHTLGQTAPPSNGNCHCAPNNKNTNTGINI